MIIPIFLRISSCVYLTEGLWQILSCVSQAASSDYFEHSPGALTASESSHYYQSCFFVSCQTYSCRLYLSITACCCSGIIIAVYLPSAGLVSIHGHLVCFWSMKKSSWSNGTYQSRSIHFQPCFDLIHLRLVAFGWCFWREHWGSRKASVVIGRSCLHSFACLVGQVWKSMVLEKAIFCRFYVSIDSTTFSLL